MDWKSVFSERILFGFMLITGYFATLWFVGFNPEIPNEARQVMRDGLLTVGPILGIIAQAIWKTDKSDKDTASAARTLAEKLSPQQPQDQGYATLTINSPLDSPVADGGTTTPPQPEPGPRFKPPTP